MSKHHSLDSLTTTDQEGRRIKIFPTEVKFGYWADKRKWVHYGLILFYLTIPWIKINGHPLLLLDIVHRRFSIFGKLFFAHEVPNLVFITMSFLVFIALITTLFGRAWCGWSCPQTVFIERVFRKIEIWIEGDAIAQKKLHLGPLTFEKGLKNTTKWIAFTLVSGVLAHSFLAYFVGATESFKLLQSSPFLHPESFIFVMVFIGVILFDFGWFREQFCLIACPYGKMQSVMMDEGSLYLAYDQKRNDCIDCMKCVRVCPTGIDVRDGLQIECIACTACADACDSVMEKIKKPKHLIGYGNIFSLAGKKTKYLRGRVALYSTMLVLFIGILSYRLSQREILQTEIIRAVDTPYQLVNDANGIKYVINHFKIRFYNLDWNDAQVTYKLNDLENSYGVELIRSGLQNAQYSVESGKFVDVQFFLKAPLQVLDGEAKKKVTIEAEWNDGKKHFATANLVGPALGI